MCNSYEARIGLANYLAAMRAAKLEPAARTTASDLPDLDMVRIGDLGPVMRLDEGVVNLSPMMFGFPNATPKGGPLFNFRSDSRSFAGANRCLIPASAFFEYTGTKYPKTRHRFTMKNVPCMAIAGLWREGEGNQPPAFTMLTTRPGADVLPYHHRQVVVLEPEAWAFWLHLAMSEEDLLRPSPEGSLDVSPVRRDTEL